MAFVSDPDDLDRFQVAINPDTERISIKGLGIPDDNFGNIGIFTTDTGVNGGTEVITTSPAHGFQTGEVVVYSKDGGTAEIGLTNNGRYWVNVITTTTLSLHTNRADSIVDANRVDLTAAGSENHELRTGKVTTAAVTFASGDASIAANTKVTFDTQDLSTVAVNDSLTIVSGADIGHYTIASVDDGNDFVIVNETLIGGDNIVTDGDFPGSSNWILQPNWSISADVATATAVVVGDALVQNVANSALTNSTIYETTFEVTAWTVGSVNIDLGGNSGTSSTGTYVSGTAGTARGATGVFTERLTTPGSTGQQIAFEISVATATLSIDHAIVTPLVTARISDGTLGAELVGSEGGTVADGVSMQALYSFLKEEWRTLSDTDMPDLIKFTFPLESITREQFEIGGPTHSNWDFADSTTRNLLRTGGWTSLNTNNTVLDIYPGIITLGSLDADTQVYFIQENTFTATPTDFVLTGPVNQALNALTVTGGFDANKEPIGQVADTTNALVTTTGIANPLSFTAPSTIDGGSATNFVTLGYSVGSKIQIVGAEDASNIGIFTVATIVNNAGTNDRLTVVSTSLTTSTGDDTSAILSPITDNRDILKLFARKKARTYVDAELADIGVTTIESIVNRFPLAHVTDPAITLNDGSLAGDPANTVFTTVTTAESGTAGDIVSQGDGTFTLTDATAAFDTGSTEVHSGDTIEITGGPSPASDEIFYEILTVDSGTVVTCFEEPLVGAITDVLSTDAEWTSRTKYVSQPVVNGVMSDPTPGDNLGRLTSSGATFGTDGVVAGDLVVITGGHIVDNPGGAGFTFATNVITDATSAFDFLAEGFIVGDRVTVSGSENTGENDGTYVIIDISGTNDVLTVQETDGSTTVFVTNTADTTATLLQNNFIGTYKVAVGGVAATTLDVSLLDPDDHFADNASGFATDINFHVIEAGMALMYREKIAGPAVADSTGLIFTTSTVQRQALEDWADANYVVGGTVTFANAEDTGNNGTFIITNVATDTITCITTAGGATPFTANTLDTVATSIGTSGHVRVLNGVSYSFNWRLFGNSGTLAQCFQYIQRQLRRGRASETLSQTDIDTSQLQFRGDIADLLMAFSTPTGTTFNMYIDDLASADLNNVTKQDITGTDRNFAFIAALTINLNDNILNASTSKVVVFYTDPDINAGSPVLGNEFGTVGAIIVQDSTPANMEALDASSSPLSFNFDFDNNVQGGRLPSGDDGANGTPVTIVSIATDTAQYVQTTGFILRQSSNIFSLVATLERNYSNP